ncbi:hypothetical protein K7I13_04825 [Brucepastera parasyntrophica]|uniref:hypothetical protein n=1 Tax=Brucepastera parasyntrophica TaxID=2880008 RepID=UPI00210CCF8D|nr:hypothetical protein [Brucepastera parasyntrophica]ULQ60607.1 hypothetical protein K7I13_04825 [Brucepastera parasyntrophica]
MSFCPFMSNPETTVECDSDCTLYLNEEVGWVWNGEVWTGCVYNMKLMELDSIRQKLESVGVSKGGYVQVQTLSL